MFKDVKTTPDDIATLSDSHPPMHICIDEREHQLYATLTDLVAYHQHPQTGPDAWIRVSKKVLPLGDVLLEHDDGRLAIMIERKTQMDLLSSIRDSRYEEQSYRLIHSSGLHPHNIIYLIEGVIAAFSQQKDRDLIYAATLSLNHYKGFSVYRTASVLESAQWLWAVAVKLHRNTLQKKVPAYGLPAADPTADQADTPAPQLAVPIPTPPPPPYCSVVKKVKKDNVTPANWGEIVLCQIPGVSSVSAVAILQKYGTLTKLTRALQTDPHCLDDVTTQSSAGHRRLSSAIIASLIKFLIDDDAPPT